MNAIGVVIPSYRVTQHIEAVIARMPDTVDRIYVVDDACPDGTGSLIERAFPDDDRIRVIRRPENGGVGAATVTGIRAALADGIAIIVKVDGDGQMDPRLIPHFTAPIAEGLCDFTKGNRFYEPERLRGMPTTRLIGNAGLSFMTKFSSGYWSLFDPTNGFLAMHRAVAAQIPWDRVAPRYFFESDLLFRLNIARAHIVDVPMFSVYADEVSSMRPLRQIFPFLLGHCQNFLKRVGYNYFLRDFNMASLHLVLSVVLLGFGSSFGLANWSATTAASAGTVMLAALPILVGFQLLLSFLQYDMSSEPKTAVHPLLSEQGPRAAEIADKDTET